MIPDELPLSLHYLHHLILTHPPVFGFLRFFAFAHMYPDCRRRITRLISWDKIKRIWQRHHALPYQPARVPMFLFIIMRTRSCDFYHVFILGSLLTGWVMRKWLMLSATKSQPLQAYSQKIPHIKSNQPYPQCGTNNLLCQTTVFILGL